MGSSDFYNAHTGFVEVSQLYQIVIGDKTHTGTLKGPLVRTGVSVTPLSRSRKEGRKEGKREGKREGRTG